VLAAAVPAHSASSNEALMLMSRHTVAPAIVVAVRLILLPF
jgi:hypothetical protein